MKQEAFIALEETLGATLHRPVQLIAQKAVDEVKRHLDAGSPILAQDAAAAISLDGVVESALPRLRSVALSCILFGAGGLSPLKDTVFYQGNADAGPVIDGLLGHLKTMVERDGAEEVRWSTSMVTQTEQFADTPVFSLFKAETLSLEDRLNAAVNGTGRAVVDIAANMTTSRLVAYGFLAQASHLKHATYQVSEVLDKRTCPVCRYMHGKTFNVSDELSRLQQTILTQDPQELRSLAPWPKQNKASLEKLFTQTGHEMQTNGLGSPPYHPGCRGMLVAHGSVEQDVPTQEPGFDLKTLLEGLFAKAKPKAPKPELVKVKIPAAVVGPYQLIIESIPDGALREQAQALLEAGNENALKDLLKANGFL